MRILAVSDTESTALWDHYNSNKITNTDLILSCGDLNPQYLSFLVSCTNIPLLYVHGNHDEKYDQTPPEGCICIDDKIYVHEGIRILGLGGCMPYKPGKYMYTEKEMKRRLLHIKHQLICSGIFQNSHTFNCIRIQLVHIHRNTVNQYQRIIISM